MKNKIFLILGIIYLKLFSNTNSQNSCAYHQDICVPFRPQPCCDKSDACRYKDGYYFCAKKEKLESQCTIDLECNHVLHTECSSPTNKCVCKSNFVSVNETTCLPILGEQCWKIEGCSAPYSECIDNKCQCSTRFSQNGTNECIQTFLGTACKNDLECASAINYSLCSNKVGCYCKFKYEKIGNFECAPTLGAYCYNNETCVTRYSTCIDSMCQCKPNYVKSGSKCIAEFLNEHCERSVDCYNIQFATCALEKRCVCSEKYIAVNKTMCLPVIGVYCSRDSYCFIKNSACIDSSCECKPGYILSRGQCVEGPHLRFCSTDKDCKPWENSRCLDKICVCDTNYTSFDKKTCKPALNGFCFNDDDCVFYGSHCVDSKCQCKPNFVAHSSSQCVSRDSLFSCKTIQECSDLWHSTCSQDNKKCVCQNNNIATGRATCLPILNGLCWIDSQCIIENSICNDFRCKCKPGFRAVADNLCFPEY